MNAPHYPRGVGYRLLVTAIVLVHFAFLGFVVFGGFLAWRWPRVIWLHALCAVWGVLIVTNLVNCPLTWAEDWARRRAGGPGMSAGFIDTHVTGVLYPVRYLNEVRLLAAAVVLVSWLGWWYRRRRRA
jgi:hypothetical protein